MNGKKVLITGGHGNLGSYITKEICQNDYEVYVLTSKLKNRIKNLKYNIIEADIKDIDSMSKKLDFDIDYCIHTASLNEYFLDGYPKKALEVNTFGTRNLLEVLSNKNLKHFIYISTFHVYGENKGIITEQSPLKLKNDYASTHLFAEYYIQQFSFTHNIKYSILRLTNSYGCPLFSDTNKWYLVLNDLCKQAYEKQQIVLKSNGKVKRDFIYMGDVAKIIYKLMALKPINEIYNLSSNQTYEVLNLAQKVKNFYKKRYNKEIEISINQSDLTRYDEIFVENKKLKSLIYFETCDRVDDEIEKIFDLLENQ